MGVVIVIALLTLFYFMGLHAQEEERKVKRFENLHTWIMGDLPPTPKQVDWGEFEQRVENGFKIGQDINNKVVEATVRMCEK